MAGRALRLAMLVGWCCSSVGAMGLLKTTRALRGGASADGIADACLAAKKASGKSYDEIAAALGYTNCYTCQLLLGQAQLKAAARPKLKAVLPDLDDATLDAMAACPVRGWDPEILKEPNVYRTYEAITHYGIAIKNLVNEKFGDGIMSAIDFYLSVDEATGVKGEKRVVITLNGKFLPFIEQLAAENTAPLATPKKK